MNISTTRIQEDKILYETCRQLSYLMYKEDIDPPSHTFGNVIARSRKIQVFKPAYIVTYNEPEECVYVGVRGTQDVEDCLTDIHGIAVEFYGTVAHAGFVNSANYLYSKLADLVKGLKKKIIVTGHSLGAAAASAFTIKLINECKEELTDIKCITFGCPGVISVRGPEMYRDYITSFINVGDVIPFACMKNIAPMCPNGVKSLANFCKLLSKTVKQMTDMQLKAVPKKKAKDTEAKTIDVDNYEDVEGTDKTRPSPLPLSDALNKKAKKITSKWPLLVPPGIIIALGTDDSPNKEIGFVEITDLRTYFEYIPSHLIMNNHSIVFYGENLRAAMKKM